MADKDSGRVKSAVGAFAASIGSQEKYILINIDALDHDRAKDAPRGASRFMPRLMAHEVLHALGFSHPMRPAQPGEKTDSRSFDQVRADIASGINSTSLLGKPDKETGRHVITYSITGNPGRVPVSPGILLNGMRHLGETKDAEHNQQNVLIQSAMKEAFDEISSVSNIVFRESADPNDANIRLFAATIVPSTDSAMSLDGGRNPLTDRSTVMSYNIAEPDQQLVGQPLKRGIFKILAPGDVDALQKTYGLPPESATRRVVTPQLMTANSGVLWSREPLSITLKDSQKEFDKGQLVIDLGARPFAPAVTGVLRDKEGREWPVSQHIGNGASVAEVDAAGSGVALDVTGALGVRVTPNKGASVKLSGRNNSVIAGAGEGNISFLKGFGNTVSGMAPDDVVTAQSVRKVWLQHWDAEGHEKGTHLTFMDEQGISKGSLFIKGKTPEEVKNQLRGLAIADTPPTVAQSQPATLDPVDFDITLSQAPGPINFSETKDTLVTAAKAAGFTLRNFSGAVAIKMTAAEFESRSVNSLDDNFYRMTFKNGDKLKEIIVQKNAKIVVADEGGKIASTIVMQETRLGRGDVKGVESDAIDKNKELEAAPKVVAFQERRDVIVDAGLAAGRMLSNAGAGEVIVKMTRPEYESRLIAARQDGYAVTFRGANGNMQFQVQPASRLAVVGADGKIERVVSLKDALREFELDLALRKGAKAEADDTMQAFLPGRIRFNGMKAV